MTAIHIVLGAPKVEEIKPLIQTEGIIIGVDRGALHALEEGIEVDVALGDFDSITDEEKTRLNRVVKETISHPSVKDDTDTEIAFDYALNNYDAENIYVYNWYGGRVDHLYSLLMVVLQKRFETLVPKLKFVSADNHIEYFLPGEHTLRKMTEMDYLSYILLTEVKGLTLKEVKYEIEDTDFERPLALISNEFIKDQALLKFEEGIIAAIQSRDAQDQ